MIDSRRLASYQEQSDRFDNRYLARLPGPEALQGLGIRHLLYVTDLPFTQEPDDLNDDFVRLPAGGVDVKAVTLSDFQPTVPGAVSGYSYGGSFAPRYWFWRSYGWHTPAPPVGSRPAPPAVRLSGGATYRSVPRQTIFSTRVVGGLAGVGKTETERFRAGVAAHLPQRRRPQHRPQRVAGALPLFVRRVKRGWPTRSSAFRWWRRSSTRIRCGKSCTRRSRRRLTPRRCRRSGRLWKRFSALLNEAMPVFELGYWDLVQGGKAEEEFESWTSELEGGLATEREEMGTRADEVNRLSADKRYLLCTCVVLVEQGSNSDVSARRALRSAGGELVDPADVREADRHLPVAELRQRPGRRRLPVSRQRPRWALPGRPARRRLRVPAAARLTGCNGRCIAAPKTAVSGPER